MKTGIKKTAFWLLAGLLCLLGLEILLRLFFLGWFTARNSPRRGVRFAAYQQSDPKNPYNWVLIPGYRVSFPMKDYRIKSLDGLPVAVKRLSLMRVNRYGFRGPEITPAKIPGVTRIMCLGDSCTFGNLEEASYPRVLERELQKSGRNAEVINAGVEGYNTVNLLLALPYDLSFKPDLATLYIGWNDLWEEPETGFWEEHFLLCRTVKGFTLWLKSPKKFIDRKFYRPLPGYRYHPTFLKRVKRILDALERNHTLPVLLTIPCLFLPDQTPDPHTLALGKVELSGNAFILAAKLRDYNQALRELAAKENIPLVDVEAWSKTALRPRSRYFMDSVHLNDLGAEKLGIYLAGELEKILFSGVRKPTPKLQAPRS